MAGNTPALNTNDRNTNHPLTNNHSKQKKFNRKSYNNAVFTNQKLRVKTQNKNGMSRQRNGLPQLQEKTTAVNAISSTIPATTDIICPVPKKLSIFNNNNLISMCGPFTIPENTTTTRYSIDSSRYSQTANDLSPIYGSLYKKTQMKPLPSSQALNESKHINSLISSLDILNDDNVFPLSSFDDLFSTFSSQYDNWWKYSESTSKTPAIYNEDNVSDVSFGYSGSESTDSDIEEADNTSDIVEIQPVNIPFEENINGLKFPHVDIFTSPVTNGTNFTISSFSFNEL